jgi:hypothetical protein
MIGSLLFAAALAVSGARAMNAATAEEGTSIDIAITVPPQKAWPLCRDLEAAKALMELFVDEPSLEAVGVETRCGRSFPAGTTFRIVEFFHGLEDLLPARAEGVIDGKQVSGYVLVSPSDLQPNQASLR